MGLAEVSDDIKGDAFTPGYFFNGNAIRQTPLT